MATFTYNNGTPEPVSLSTQPQQAAITVSVTISFTDPNTKIAGHSIVNLNGVPSIEDVQFTAHELDTAANLNSKALAMIINVSKFTMAASDVAATTTSVTCQVQLLGNGILIKEYLLDDSNYSESNSVFIYIFNFSTQAS